MIIKKYRQDVLLILNFFDLFPKVEREFDIKDIDGVNIRTINTVKKLRKSDFFLDLLTMGEQIIQTGVIGRIVGASVIISNRLTNIRSYILMLEYV